MPPAPFRRLARCTTPRSRPKEETPGGPVERLDGGELAALSASYKEGRGCCPSGWRGGQGEVSSTRARRRLRAAGVLQSRAPWMRPTSRALAIDQVRRGRTPDAVDPARHVTGGVQEDERGVPALLRRLLHEVRTLAEVHEQDLEPLGLELPVPPVDGRQLLPAVGSPGRPEEEQDDLAAKVFEANGAPVERG
jgi:hypothetical protein